MTALLEQAWAEVSGRPEREQEMVAQIILDTLRDEQEWERQFAESSDFLEYLADNALASYEAGRTRELR